MRHPQVEAPPGLCYGQLDLPLAEGWQKQVLSWPGQGPLITSPAKRCLEVAQFLAATYGANYQIDERLSELNFGAWEGRYWDDLPREELSKWAEQPLSYRLGNGDTVNELISRVTSFWDQYRVADASCRVITHGGPLRVFAALIRGQVFDPVAPAPPQGSGFLVHLGHPASCLTVTSVEPFL